MCDYLSKQWACLRLHPSVAGGRDPGSGERNLDRRRARSAARIRRYAHTRCLGRVWRLNDIIFIFSVAQGPAGLGWHFWPPGTCFLLLQETGQGGPVGRRRRPWLVWKQYYYYYLQNVQFIQWGALGRNVRAESRWRVTSGQDYPLSLTFLVKLWILNRDEEKSSTWRRSNGDFILHKKLVTFRKSHTILS